MKKTLFIALAGCKAVSEPEPVAVESVTLNATTLTLAPGAKGKLTATITANAGGKEAKCQVTVRQILVAVQSVALDQKTLTLTRGETGKLTATVLPENADDKTVLWSSSDTSVATVDNDGTVTVHKAGEAKITAQAGDIKAECAITVNPILVESVTLDETELTLTRGETGKLTATVTPNNADDTTVTWSSSDTAVAKVGDDGTITAVSKGTATITAQAGGKTATCMVTVHAHTIQGGNTCTECKIELKDFEISGSVLTKYKGNAATVYILDGVTSIKMYAFKGCTSLKSVTIPDGVTSIGRSAFYGCTGLTSVTIPASVTSIEEYAFSGCTSLASVTIPGSVTSIGEMAFYGCDKLTDVTYGGTLAQWCAMDGNSLMYYAKHVTVEGTDLKQATTLVIPNGVTSIGRYAFENCTNLASVTIPDGVTSIGWGAFYKCTSLASVEIPDGVTSIGGSAFQECTSLASVKIPDGVTSIGNNAFDRCASLTSVTYGGTKEEWGDIEKGSYIFSNTSVTQITDKDGVTFTVDRRGNITE